MSFNPKRHKRLLRKCFLGACLFALGACILYGSKYLLRAFLPLQSDLHPLLSILILTLSFIVLYKPIDKGATRMFKSSIFKRPTFAHVTLMNLAEDLSLVLDLKELSNVIVNTFGDMMHLKSVALAMPRSPQGDFSVTAAYGWHVSDQRRARVAADGPLLKVVRKMGPHVLVREQAVRMFSWQDANSLAKDFDAMQASWVIPLWVREQLVGLLTFSSVLPQGAYDEPDFHFFREFARVIAKHLYNARQFHEMQEQLEELQDKQGSILQSAKLAAIEQLATGIAHEIHNPLTIISGKAQVLLLQKDRSGMDTRIEEVLKTIVKQTKRAADITRKLLMFSQGPETMQESVSLDQIIEDTIALVSYQTSLEGIRITRSVRHPLPALRANVQELREVFLNLVLNAVQSVDRQGTIHIEIIHRASDHFIEVLVSDTGKGIPEENLDKLFNPFFTTKEGAVGLGLFLVKQIVNRYGGSIRVESRMGEGSLFILRLPESRPGSSREEPEETQIKSVPQNEV